MAEPDPRKRANAETGKVHQFQLQCAWLKIVLKDDAGRPIPKESYRVLQTARTPIEGTLDENGYAYVEGLLRGKCTVIFPNIDKADWTLPGNPEPAPGLEAPEHPWLAPPPPPPPPPLEPTWAALQDDRGNPIAGETYQLLRGGTVLYEGLTDIDGRVKELWIEPGPYSVRFPNIDKSDWILPKPPELKPQQPDRQPPPSPDTVSQGDIE